MKGVPLSSSQLPYDNNFFLNQIKLVSGTDSVTTPIVQDTDGLVTSYGPFTFTRNGPGGAVNQISTTSLTVAVGYDSLGRVSTRSHTVNGTGIYSIQLSYDSRGNISQKTENVSGTTSTWGYTYDSDGQLTNVTKNGVNEEVYTYGDQNGNRTGYQRTTSNISSGHDSQDRLVQVGGTLYTFNADGQMIQRGDDTFTYSSTGELLQATVSGKTISYAYDGMHRRVAHTDSSGTYQYLYGNLKKTFQLTAMRDPAGVLSYYYYDDAGLLFAFDKGGVRYYVATDQVGTPKTINDATGAVVKYLEYDSFGMPTLASNPDFFMPVGFAGGVTDTTTGLVRFGYRDYEPNNGRWTAKDPIFFDGGQGNLYQYVSNNPVNFIDPTGLINLTKTGVGLANIGRGMYAGATGLAAIIPSIVAIGSGEGAPIGALGLSYAMYQFGIAFPGLTKRGLKQVEEGLSECKGSISLGSLDNLLGLAPLGDQIDDPNEKISTALKNKKYELLDIQRHAKESPEKGLGALINWLQDLAI